MQDGNQESSNIGVGILLSITAFAASWAVFLAITKTTGLALVFSVFVALIAFDMGRRSLKAAFVIFSLSIVAILLEGLFYLAY